MSLPFNKFRLLVNANYCYCRRSFGLSSSCYSFVKDVDGHYKALNLDLKASKAEIKAAFIKLSKKYHPDLNKDTEAQFRRVAEAYQVLGNNDRKRSYDIKIGNVRDQRGQEAFIDRMFSGPIVSEQHRRQMEQMMAMEAEIRRRSAKIRHDKKNSHEPRSPRYRDLEEAVKAHHTQLETARNIRLLTRFLVFLTVVLSVSLFVTEPPTKNIPSKRSDDAVQQRSG